MRTGLVSITFRKLAPDALVKLALRCGLECIEWGGDVHVPHGKVEIAREVARQTRDHGLDVCAYGSYYTLAESEKRDLAFGDVLESAVALGAPAIRIWAGKKASADADAGYRTAVEADALRIADLARAAGVAVCYEFHANSLTDTAASAKALLDATRHPAIFSLWQPPNGQSVEVCMDGLELVLPRLRHMHAFHWWPDARHRLPLAEGEGRWKKYLARVRKAGMTPDVLLEFVPGDDPEILQREAATLKSWLANF